MPARPPYLPLARLPPALLGRLALHGHHERLPKRLQAHAAGRASKYTRSRLPVRLAYQEAQRSKSAALKPEAAIKGLRRAEKERLVAKR